MADQGTQAAMVDPGIRAAMADPRIPWAMADQGTLWAMAGNPPPKIIFLGKSTTSGGRSGVDSVSSWTGAGSGVD